MLNTAAREYRPQTGSWSLPRFLLRKWLRGRWTLVFSNPDDFANYGFEADRWIEQVREALHADSIAAVAVGPGDRAGWITGVGGCFISQRTFDSMIDCRPDRRFVMVLDDALQLRRTFLYSSADQLPSPIGLASLAASCRLRA